MTPRDSADPHYPRRLAASTLASLIVHVLLALLLVGLVMNASQEGATENVAGGSIVTLERQTAAVPSRSTRQSAAPVTHVPRIAPARQAAFVQAQTQRLPQSRHELAREMPSAPPNARQVPQQTPQPNPAPTRNVYEVAQRPELPAAPVSVPTQAPVAVALRARPSIAPSPVPTAVAAALRSPRPPLPTNAPIARKTPAPPAASPAPSPLAAVAATSVPRSSPAPATAASAPPATRSGVPSPSPTTPGSGKTSGAAPSPGPKGRGSPGPRAGLGAKTVAQTRRPFELHPTPSPKPAASRRPPPDINARLRALLPHNPVNPTNKQYTPHISLQGSLEPTPPPSVLAQTKFLFNSEGAGSEGRVEMWVTQVRGSAPFTLCTGWLVRYPLNARASHPGDFAPANGTQITVGGGRGTPALMPPVVDGIVTLPCEKRLLVPYAPSPAPSP